MFVTSYSVTYCIYIPGKPGFYSHYYCAVYDECKYLDTFWLADRFRLFVHYPISLSSLCKLIWRHWTYKMPVRYILSSVWVRLSTFSQLSIIQYMGLCVFSLPISLVMIERIYYHHQIGSMNYYPLFRVRSWNNGMRCMFSIFLWGECTEDPPHKGPIIQSFKVSLFWTWTKRWTVELLEIWDAMTLLWRHHYGMWASQQLEHTHISLPITEPKADRCKPHQRLYFILHLPQGLWSPCQHHHLCKLSLFIRLMATISQMLWKSSAEPSQPVM